MKAAKLKKRTKVFLIIITILVVGFAAYTALWFVHYNTLIKPMLKNKDIMTCKQYDDTLVKEEYEYIDEDGVGYSVFTPHFLKFNGNLSAGTPEKYDENWNREVDYTYSLMYKPYLFHDNNYRFTVNVFSPEEKALNADCDTYFIRTDSKLNLVEGDEEIYKKHYDQIADLYERCKKLYGEDVFTD